MYRCILEARNAVISAMKPGLTVNNLKEIAEEVYKKHGFHKEFLALNRYIGHHVGISVHDVNASDPSRRFEPGVVFNVEPLLEFRDKKIHMRLKTQCSSRLRGGELTQECPPRLTRFTP